MFKKGKGGKKRTKITGKKVIAGVTTIVLLGAAGTVLATVDSSSVLDAVENVQSELTELDDKISTCQEDDEENTIESPAAGRIKKIYVASNSEVTDSMLENGTLMVLSLDGYMAADLTDVSDTEEGETVNVILSDGTVVSGTIAEKNEDGSCTVTVTDNGTTFGDTLLVLEGAGSDAEYAV